MALIDSWHLIFLGTILAVCQAMPYHKNKINDHAKIFHDESSESLMPKKGENKSEQVTPISNAKWMHWNADKTRSRSNEHSSAAMRDIADPCQNVFCHVGRVCQPDDLGKGQCVCGDAAMCLGHHRVVCGTNGVYYPSHCELHRMACLLNTHISTDLTNKACEDRIQNDELPTVGESPVKTTESSDKHQLPDREDDSMDYDDEEDDGSDEYLYEDEEEEDDEEDHGIEDEDEDSSVEDSSVEDGSEEEDDGMLCSDEDYRRLKNNLLLYHCARIGDSDCTEEFKRKQFLASVMFNYYDHNSDTNLDATELHDIEHRDHLSQLSRSCGLGDMLSRDDTSGDDAISLSEFYAAFSIPSVVLDAHLRDFTTLVTVGSSIELKCDITGSTELIWKRNGAQLDKLTGDDVKTFDDGSLYISNLGLHSIGNYTCQDVQNNEVVQTHIVKVQLPPSVEVRPSTQFHTSGSTVVLKCHANGIPQPHLSWEINESALPADNSANHYALLHANATLEIMHAAYTRDTGAYKCKARNAAGSSQDIATVFIEKSDVPPYTASSTQDSREVFVVFHDDGYTVYEPSHCYIEHQVSGDFSNFILQPPYGASLHTLCEGEKPCSWGAAVNVRNRFIYVSQPQLNRVIVIEIQKRSNPVEVITTDATPVTLQYVSHLDQVWVVCWKDNDSIGARSVVVIREASKGERHGIVHPQSTADGLDQMDDVFLPPTNDLQETFEYGYAMKRGQEALYKLQLHSMQYVKTIDLSAHMCVPQAVTFIPIGGKVMVTCATPSGQSTMSSHVVIDYMTDEIVSNPDSGGDIYVSPDSRYIVIIDSEGNTLTVSSVTDDGRLVYRYDAYSNVHISAVTFFPCDSDRGYDLYASSKDKNDVLYMNLSSGKVEMIEGIGQPPKTSALSWDTHSRSIVASGVFGEYLMTVSRDAVVLIDGKRRHVQCEWQNIKNGNVIIWVDPTRL